MTTTENPIHRLCVAVGDYREIKIAILDGSSGKILDGVNCPPEGREFIPYWKHYRKACVNVMWFTDLHFASFILMKIDKKEAPEIRHIASAIEAERYLCGETCTKDMVLDTPEAAGKALLMSYKAIRNHIRSDSYVVR